MAIPGERFVLDLSDDDEDLEHQPAPAALTNLIGEIKERTPKPPTAPALKTSSKGFPTSKNRLAGSAFKQQRRANALPAVQPRSSYSYQSPAARQQPPRTASSEQSISPEDEEKRIIDEENNQRLAAMSDAEIESEKADLLANLSPSLIERLLRRANIDDEPATSVSQPDIREEPDSKPIQDKSDKKKKKSVSFDVDVRDSEEATGLDDRPPAAHPPDLLPASEFPSGPIHFPTPPPRQTPMPNLDPSSPSFYDDLQAHYFPDTPHDSSALSWLKPRTEDDDNGADPRTLPAYHPSSSTTQILPSALRFSFRGEMLPPSKSLLMSTSLGLHHHADDPEAAGYTLPELSILSRSTVPTQRCIAWQVFGRILFRLGSGEFGASGSDLVEGLWKVVEHEDVVSRMLEEAEGGPSQERRGQDTEEKESERVDMGFKSNIGKHASAKAWAVEGIWLWQKGGGIRGIVSRTASDKT
jgi:RNA polymerase II-associated protein 1